MAMVVVSIVVMLESLVSFIGTSIKVSQCFPVKLTGQSQKYHSSFRFSCTQLPPFKQMSSCSTHVLTFSQCSPCESNGHSQTYPTFLVYTHVPFLKHGLNSQGLCSSSQVSPFQPISQIQFSVLFETLTMQLPLFLQKPS